MREAVCCLVEEQAASPLGEEGLRAVLSARDDLMLRRQRWEDVMPEDGLAICAGLMRSSGVQSPEL